MRRYFILGCWLLLCAYGVVAQNSIIPQGEKLLAWIAPGAEPGDQPSNSSGKLVFINGDGSQETVLDIPALTAHVTPCGDVPTSPDGRQFAFYVGSDKGTIYMMTGILPQLQIVHEDINTMTCTGNPTFRFSPDSARFAYMEYADAFNLDVSPSGRLHIRTTSTYETLATLDAVAAFDIDNAAVATVTFFYNEDNEGIEAEIELWNGTSQQAIASVTAEDRCYYTSASVDILPDGRLAAILGHRCEMGDGRTRWQLYMVDPSSRSMTQVMSDVSPGRYFAPAMTNQLFATAGMDRVYFTVPDGLTNNTVSIYSLALSDMGIAPVIDGQAVVSSVSTKPYMRTNHTAILTPDNHWLAMVRNDANNNARLTLLELAAPELPPIELPLAERSAIIDEMIFSPDYNQLWYVTSGAGSALYRLDLLTGAESRIARGVYGRGVLSPQGTALALVAYETINDRDTYMKLVVYDLTTNSETLLFTGAEIVENKITNQQFVYPLAWRSGQ